MYVTPKQAFGDNAQLRDWVTTHLILRLNGKGLAALNNAHRILQTTNNGSMRIYESRRYNWPKK